VGRARSRTLRLKKSLPPQPHPPWQRFIREVAGMCECVYTLCVTLLYLTRNFLFLALSSLRLRCSLFCLLLFFVLDHTLSLFLALSIVLFLTLSLPLFPLPFFLFFSLSFFLSLSLLSLSLALALSLSFSLTNSLSHTLSLSLSHALSLACSHSLSFLLSFALTLALSLALVFFLSLPPSLYAYIHEHVNVNLNDIYLRIHHFNGTYMYL